MSLNGYSWVEGNTPNMVDPSGKNAAMVRLMNSGVCLEQANPCSDQDRLLNPFSCPKPEPELPVLRGAFGDCFAGCIFNILQIDKEACVRRCMERKYEEEGGCKIEIYSYNVNYLSSIGVGSIPALQPNHAFVVYWEGDDGIVYHGLPDGPTGPVQIPTTKIRVTSQRADLGNSPGEPDSDYVTWQKYGGAGPLIVSIGQEACNIKTCLDQQVERMDEIGQQTTYDAYSTNSNSVARGFLQSCGLPAVDIGNNISQPLPGFDNDLFVDPDAQLGFVIRF